MILTEKQQKQRDYNPEKLINMIVLQVNKYYLMIKDKLQNKLSLLILPQEKLWGNKQERLKTKEDA